MPTLYSWFLLSTQIKPKHLNCCNPLEACKLVAYKRATAQFNCKHSKKPKPYNKIRHIQFLITYQLVTITSVLGSALLVFCRMTTPSQKLGNNINNLSTLHATTQDSLEAMEVDTMATNKRSKPIGEKNTQKKSKQDIAIFLFRNPIQPEFWFGFQVVEQLAKEEGRASLSIDMPLIDLVAMGYLQQEARELQTSYISYPRVPQKLWPTSRTDGIVGQHVNVTQLSFDVEINQETGLT